MFGRRTSPTDTTATTPPPGSSYSGTGVWPAVIFGLVLAVALVIFVAQNGHAVRLHWLWLHFRASPAVLVLVTAVAAIAAAVIVGALWRRGRRRVLNEREELAQLRRTAATATVDSDAPGAGLGGEAGGDDIDLRRDEPRTMPT
jgi:uncharacterized integral membrane protein